jgi:hypothetical protein
MKRYERKIQTFVSIHKLKYFTIAELAKKEEVKASNCQKQKHLERDG